MRIAWAVLLAIFLTAVVASAAPTTEPSQILSADEVKKLVNAGQYTDALKALMRFLDLKGPAAAGYDRHEMLMLRAECQLQIKQTKSAIETLDTTRKEAIAATSEEHEQQAAAFAILIEKSPSYSYTPLTGLVRKPISILDRTLRKAAYDALFADQLFAAQAKAKQAKTANNLRDLAAAAKLVVAARPVELASAGDHKQTDEILTDLAKTSLKMVSDATNDIGTDVKLINDRANRLVTEDYNLLDAKGRPYTATLTHRAGLTTKDSTNLKDDIANCDKIVSAAGELAQFFASVDSAPFKAVAAKATSTKDKATATLNDDYLANVSTH